MADKVNGIKASDVLTCIIKSGVNPLESSLPLIQQSGDYKTIIKNYRKNKHHNTKLGLFLSSIDYLSLGFVPLFLKFYGIPMSEGINIEQMFVIKRREGIFEDNKIDSATNHDNYIKLRNYLLQMSY